MRLRFTILLILSGFFLQAQTLVQYDRDSLQRVRNPFTRDWDLVRRNMDDPGNKFTVKFVKDSFNAVINPYSPEREFNLVRRETAGEGSFILPFNKSLYDVVNNPFTGHYDLLEKPASEPTPSDPLILEWDNIANVPLCDYSDAPAPGNITITPDAVGDNPVTWYFRIGSVFTDMSGDYRSLLSDEIQVTVGDATTLITLNCTANYDESGVIVASGTQTNLYNTVYLDGINTIPFTSIPCNLLSYSVPLGGDLTVEQILSMFQDPPINQVCTPGDPTDVDNWNTFFGLPTNGDPFTSVTVAGNSVYLYGGGEMTLTNGETGFFCGDIGGNPQLFESNAHIKWIDDQAGIVVSVANWCFIGMELSGENCIPVSILEYFNSNSCTTVGDGAFASCTSLTSMAAGITTVGEGAFDNCTSLTSMAAGITTVGVGAFYGCTSLTSMAAGITTVGNSAFVGCTSLTSMLIPLCTTLGTDCTNNGVFAEITGLTITVTCDASLLTCNAGAPDGDLCYLAANNTITVNGAPLAGCGGD